MRPSTPTDLELDFRERDGFQIGRAAALADWEARREDKAFARLCSRLYQRRWAKKRRAEQPERVRGNLCRWRRANGERIRAQERARRAKKRKPIRLTCGHCGAAFSPRRYRTAKWCSTKCRNANHAKHRKPRSKGLRNMQLGPTVFAVLREEPGLTLREILERAPTVKRGSLATKLTAWVQDGSVLRESGRYRLP